MLFGAASTGWRARHRRASRGRRAAPAYRRGRSRRPARGARRGGVAADGHAARTACACSTATPPTAPAGTAAIKAYNQRAASDPALSAVLLTVRDGLSLIRRRHGSRRAGRQPRRIPVPGSHVGPPGSLPRGGWSSRSGRRADAGVAWGAEPGAAAYTWPPVFDALSEKLQATLSDVRGRGTLTEDDIKKAMREIRLALLEADVNFKVVKEFTTTVRERCAGRRRRRPAQPRPAGRQDRQRGARRAHGRRERRRSSFSPRPPTVDPHGRPAGLGQDDRDGQARQAPARPSTARSVARRRLRRLPPRRGRPARQGRRPGRAPTVYEQGTDKDPVDIARWALDQAKMDGKDVLIVDTAGRLHVDESLMDELVEIRDGGQAAHDPARRRRDDRPGRGQRRRAVRRGRSTSTAS